MFITVAVVTPRPKTGTGWVGILVKRPTNNYIMETGAGLTVWSERLEERKIEPATIGMQYEYANHCAK